MFSSFAEKEPNMDKSNAYLLWFEQLERKDVDIVGGKSSSLGEMTSKTDVPVPYGFATTAHAYRYFIDQTGLREKMRSILAELTDVENSELLSSVCVRLRGAIMEQEMPQDLQDAIRRAYEELAHKMNEDEPYVAVRSSATAEDLPDASFAGQQDTYLNVHGADQVIRKACAKAGVTVGKVCSLPTKITKLWTGSTPADIINDVLDTCTSATGKQYRHRVDDSGLQVEVLPTAPIKAFHKPAANIAAFDITWALGQVSGEDSIEDTYNAVVIAAEDDGKAYIGAQASNAASIKRYGFMQHIETVTENPARLCSGKW